MSRATILLIITMLAAGGPITAQTPDETPRETIPSAFQLSDAQIWQSIAQGIPAGSTVRIRVARGERIRAVLMTVNDEGIVIKPKGRLPEPTRMVAFRDIDILEVDQQRGLSAGKATAIGIGAGAAGGLAFLLVMLAAFAD
jgi:hypothetical protein